jgi:hypothetical protein
MAALVDVKPRPAAEAAVGRAQLERAAEDQPAARGARPGVGRERQGGGDDRLPGRCAARRQQQRGDQREGAQPDRAQGRLARTRRALLGVMLMGRDPIVGEAARAPAKKTGGSGGERLYSPLRRMAYSGVAQR